MSKIETLKQQPNETKVEVPLHHLAPADLRQSLQSSKEAEYNKRLGMGFPTLNYHNLFW